jgi:hypothetical protein
MFKGRSQERLCFRRLWFIPHQVTWDAGVDVCTVQNGRMRDKMAGGGHAMENLAGQAEHYSQFSW